MGFTLDWTKVIFGGQGALTSGEERLGVRVLPSSEGDDGGWSLGGGRDGGAKDLETAAIDVAFDRDVLGLAFDLSDANGEIAWTDKVTVLATNAAGEEVQAIVVPKGAATAPGTTASGSRGQGPDAAPETVPETVTIRIDGPVANVRIVQHTGPGGGTPPPVAPGATPSSGTPGPGDRVLAMSDWTIVAAPQVASAPDGIVDGTDDDDVIIVDDFVDRDGEQIDNQDAILPGDGPDDDRVEAGDGDDFVDARLGDDTVDGGDGDDTLTGGVGDDSVDGGDGNDIVIGDLGDDTVIGGDGNDTLSGDEGDDSLVGGEGNDFILAGSGDDTLVGGDGNDSLFGGGGDDVAEGGDGNDEFFGGDGNDTFTAGEGNDTFIGGDDRDTFVLTGGDENDNDVFFGGSEGDDIDTIDVSQIGKRGVDWDLENVTTDSDGNGIDGTFVFLDGSGEFDFVNVEIICFTPGTRIATPKGPRPVEELCAGDRVLTRDNGAQEIAWYGQTGLNAADFVARPHLTPVLIRAGALGRGLPERDMMVSPQHRVLVQSDRAALYFDDREVLVAAKHLVNGTTIVRNPVPQTTYIHFLCERHEVVLSDGAWTESFQPGDYSLNGIDAAQREEIVELFPDLGTREGLRGYGAARRTLKRHEARALLS